MAKVTYKYAPEVEEMAAPLIEKYHSHLLDFKVKIRYLFTDKTPKKGGKEVWAYVRKVSSLNAFLASGDDEVAEEFFIMVVSEPVWDLLPPSKRMPLVDHELCHLWAEVNEKDEDDDDPPDNPVKLSLNPHDVEEHTCIVRRWGLWREDVEDFVNAALKKKRTDEGDTEEEEEEGVAAK